MTTKLKFLFLLELTTVIISSQAAILERLSNDDTVIKAGDPVKYVGGVLEYEAYEDWEGGGENIVRENVRIISEYVAEAKTKGVDILVTPEYGLMGLEFQFVKPQEFFSLLQFIPDPDLRIVPCTTPVDPPNVVVAQDMSCTAKENAMYVVVDVGEAAPCSPNVRNPYNNTLDTSGHCPAYGYVYYNTQVVFDRDGAVIARYRKKNLFLEPVFHPGMDPDETAIFTTDFGVTFTLLVCFDIAFYRPAVYNHVTYGIQDAIMSTAWFDVLPFFLASNVQNSLSRGLGLNLLVAGFHYPEKAKLGSGIFRGATDLEFNYLADPESGTRLLVSEVDTVASVDVALGSTSRMSGTVANHEMLKGKASVPLGNTSRKPRTVANHELLKGKEEPDSQANRKRKFYYDDISEYTNVPLEHGDGSSGDVLEAVACHNDDFCCRLTYHPTGKLNYSLVAFSGLLVKELGFHLYSEVCSVLWCQTDDVTTCSYIEEGLPETDTFGALTLEGVFNTTFVYPGVVDRNLSVLDNSLYNFTTDEQRFILSTNGPVTDMLSCTIFSRLYDDMDGLE
ncbi:pantetheinase-like [Palaemon carinicauda]|uniref:pantetheinase-like n=1 Tax=Palaemon carinicauda TaxID=392227 RepID=UPI0035B63188